ncbi:MAG TPA: hypothetical protein VI589_08410, partial [Vicinamibacteria bacterium]
TVQPRTVPSGTRTKLSKTFFPNGLPVAFVAEAFEVWGQALAEILGHGTAAARDTAPDTAASSQVATGSFA